MTAYRQQQLRAAALIEQDATAEQIAEVFGWVRSAQQTGTTDTKKTLTVPTECGILVSIRRYIRRKVKEVHTMTITLTQDAYPCSGTCRLHTDTGAPSTWCLSDWYEAAATDADGNTYRVIWALRDDYDPATNGESDACDWTHPVEVVSTDTGEVIADYALA